VGAALLAVLWALAERRERARLSDEVADLRGELRRVEAPGPRPESPTSLPKLPARQETSPRPDRPSIPPAAEILAMLQSKDPELRREGAHALYRTEDWTDTWGRSVTS
jgi:hypothetical protein